jgi:ABC-type uncharacterized transport system substrate-binding protein
MLKIFILSLLAYLTPASYFLADAQQPSNLPRVGYVSNTGSSVPEPFLQGLRNLGYSQGKNIAIHYRTTGGNSQLYPKVFDELIRLQVSVIVTETSSAALAAKKATQTIPIVMTSSTDPVGTGLIASFSHPGGNVTGLTSLNVELGGKLLDLLKEILPRLSRVAIPAPSKSATEPLFIKATEGPALALKIELIRVPIRGPEDYEEIFRVVAGKHADALLIRIPASTPIRDRKRFVELAAKNRVPAIYTAIDWIEIGGLMSYGRNRGEQYRRVATYVDKILKGAKPADLPVEAPKDFDLAINLKTAKQIGLTIPQSLLFRADKVIR